MLKNSKENTNATASFSIKLQTLGLQLYLNKEILAQVLFLCDFCEPSKNIFFREHLWAIAFEINEIS